MPLRVYLTEEEDALLLEMTSSNHPPRVRQRAQALRLSYQGWNVPRIAAYLKCAASTVRQTFRRWWDGKFEGLEEEEGRGSKRRWTDEDIDFLLQRVAEENCTFTAAQLVRLLAETRGVELSADRLSRILKKKTTSGRGCAKVRQR
jgi:transposase